MKVIILFYTPEGYRYCFFTFGITDSFSLPYLVFMD